MTSNSPTPDIIFKQYDFENLDNLIEIYQRCFGTKPSPGYFKWKYLDNPAGKAIAFVAIYNGKIAGFYGVIPEFYVINGKTQIIYQSMDTMTDPNYRRLGLFAKLANMTYDYLRQKDGEIHLIGFPGEMSFRGFVDKLHWNAIIRLRYLFIHPLLFRSLKLLRTFPEYEIEPISSFGEDFDDYFARKGPSLKPISKYLNRDILNWRLAEHPDIHYKIAKILADGQMVGYFSYRLHEKRGAFILNMDVIKNDVLLNSLNCVCRYLFSMEKVRTIYTFQSGSGLQPIYRQLGFFANPFSKGPFSYRTPFIVYGDKKISGIDWYDSDNFDIQPIVRDY